MVGIRFSKDEIRVFCQRHRMRKLALFGSVLRPDFDSESDIDILVEFDRRFARLDLGPGAVARWREMRGPLPPDIFVEEIPFEETREYVKSVVGAALACTSCHFLSIPSSVPWAALTAASFDGAT